MTAQQTIWTVVGYSLADGTIKIDYAVDYDEILKQASKLREQGLTVEVFKVTYD